MPYTHPSDPTSQREENKEETGMEMGDKRGRKKCNRGKGKGTEENVKRTGRDMKKE